MESLNFYPVAGPFWIGLVTVALVAMLMIGPSFEGLTWRRRSVLTLLRIVSIALVLLALVRPGCMTTVERRQTAVMYVLLDTSRSMDLPHRDEKIKRWKALSSMLLDNMSGLDNLREQQVDLRFLGFDQKTQSIDYADGILMLPKNPAGAETDIGRALADVLGGVREERLLGVVVASDGVQNVADSEIDLVNIAKDFGNMSVPIFAVPFGTAAEVGQFADVAIANLPDHDTVFVKNRKTVRASLISRGYANQPIRVQLVISGKGQLERVVDEQVYTPRQSYEEQTVELSYVPQVAGSFRMTVRALMMPNEQSTLNNQLTSFLTVYEGGLRIALISNIGWWEQSRLRRVLASKADSGGDTQGIDVDFFPINPQAYRTPLDYSGVFGDQSYDMFMFVDVDSRVFLPQNMQLLQNAVANGKGLIMCGGTHSFGPGYYWNTPLNDVLPIAMRPDERQEFERDVRQDFHILGPIELVPAVDHPLVRLSDEPNFASPWKDLPPMPSVNRFVGVKPTAEVLIKSAKNEPVLVAGKYGNGRVLAFAANSTWLWYNHRFRDEYQRFWQQVVLWLAVPDGSAKDTVRIYMPQRRFQPGSTVTFSTEARTVTGQAIPTAVYEARLLTPSGVEHLAPVVPGRNLPVGELNREWVSEPGIYSVRVEAKDNGESIGESEIEFEVSDQDKEKANPSADVRQLARLAEETKDAGGRIVAPEDFGKFLIEIADQPGLLKIEIPQRWHLGNTATDASLFLIFFVAVMSVEWALRKKWGLV